MKQVFCNKCGKQILEDAEDFLSIEKVWGYYSSNDSMCHSFDLCEKCYLEFTNTFIIRLGIINDIT